MKGDVRYGYLLKFKIFCVDLPLLPIEWISMEAELPSPHRLRTCICNSMPSKLDGQETVHQHRNHLKPSKHESLKSTSIIHLFWMHVLLYYIVTVIRDSKLFALRRYRLNWNMVFFSSETRWGETVMGRRWNLTEFRNLALRLHSEYVFLY